MSRHSPKEIERIKRVAARMTVEPAGNKAHSLHRLVRPTDIAIFDCPCCGKSVGIHNKSFGVAAIRKHYHTANPTKECLFSRLTQTLPLRFRDQVRPNDALCAQQISLVGHKQKSAGPPTSLDL